MLDHVDCQSRQSAFGLALLVKSLDLLPHPSNILAQSARQDVLSHEEQGGSNQPGVCPQAFAMHPVGVEEGQTSTRSVSTIEERMYLARRMQKKLLWGKPGFTVGVGIADLRSTVGVGIADLRSNVGVGIADFK